MGAGGWQALEARLLRERGIDLAGYTTVESADDIDAVRRHEKHTDRLLLFCPKGPDHTLKLPNQSQVVLEALADLAAADPVWGAHLPSMLSTLEALLKRLDEHPVVVEVEGQEVGISKFDVQKLIARSLSTIRSSGELIPGAILAMSQGDFEAVAKELLDERREAGIASAMQNIMDCASGAGAERKKLIASQSATCLLGDAANIPFGRPGLAEAWGAPDLGNDFRAPLESEVPVLFIIGDLDYRTPISNAEELVEGVPNAQLIVVQKCRSRRRAPDQTGSAWSLERIAHGPSRDPRRNWIALPRFGPEGR